MLFAVFTFFGLYFQNQTYFECDGFNLNWKDIERFDEAKIKINDTKKVLGLFVNNKNKRYLE